MPRTMRTWLLPDYIEDILPEEARRIERLRRLLLNDFAVHGYELVMPPLLEYVDSLLTGTGHDLDLQMFKLVDQLSGRMLGVRADITPQVARIDAHLLNRGGVTRLCYSGSVLRTIPDSMNRTREPMQIGVEIYGHRGIESDIEVQRLMLRALGISGVRDLSIDIGHVGVFRALLHRARASREVEGELFQAMQAKDASAINVLSRRFDRPTRAALMALPGLYGGTEVLARARRTLPALPEICTALRDLSAISRRLADLAQIRSFDLAELRGYHYHSGVVFAAYASNSSNAVAQGGRYDEVGKAFGRARPATGFSMDLRELAATGAVLPAVSRVLAPYRSADRALQMRIAALRARGTIVIEELPGHARYRTELGCDRKLVSRQGRWIIVKIR